jgi:hypothetical protein
MTTGASKQQGGGDEVGGAEVWLADVGCLKDAKYGVEHKCTWWRVSGG